MKQLDPDDSRPKYIQVADIVRQAVVDGDYAPGARLPSRLAIAAHLDVSPQAIGQGIRLLLAEGILVSRQGSGVYVRTRPPKPRDLAAEVDELARRIKAIEELLAPNAPQQPPARP